MKYSFVKIGVSKESLWVCSFFLSKVFKSTDKFTPSFLKWQYAENPEGIVEGFNAFHKKKLVAHYATIPVVYLINGKKRKGLLSLNTAVDAEHRGENLFTQLAEKTYEQGIKNGYEFVIGVSNRNSTHGFLKKLGFYLISPLDVKMGIGQLPMDTKKQYLAKPFWSSELYHWRLSSPNNQYLKGKNIIYSQTNIFGIYSQVSDLNNQEEISINLPKVRNGFIIWSGLAKFKKRFNLFLSFPTMLKPSPLNLIFKDLKGGLPRISAKDIYFEFIDFDAY